MPPARLEAPARSSVRCHRASAYLFLQVQTTACEAWASAQPTTENAGQGSPFYIDEHIDQTVMDRSNNPKIDRQCVPKKCPSYYLFPAERASAYGECNRLRTIYQYLRALIGDQTDRAGSVRSLEYAARSKPSFFQAWCLQQRFASRLAEGRQREVWGFQLVAFRSTAKLTDALSRHRQ